MEREQAYEMLERFMQQMVPFNRHLGMRVGGLDEGRARLELPFREEFIGDPFRPALHGGLISTLVDTCGGLAVATTFQNIEDRASTVDLRVDYLRPGRMEDLIAEARVVRAGNRVAVVALSAFHPGAQEAPVASGTGVYNVRRVQDR